MCGRYQRRSDKQKIAEAFHLGNVDGLALEFAPDYNAAPQSTQPVIVWDEAGGTRLIHMMFWRFLPPFVMDPKKFSLDTINARGESLLSRLCGERLSSNAAASFPSMTSSSGKGSTPRRSCLGRSR
jgi:putative SOS response-associated peptidase YedK